MTKSERFILRPVQWLGVLFVATLGLPIILLACGLLTLASLLRLDGDARALSDSFLGSRDLQWQRRIEVNARWPVVSLARAGLGFAKLEPEARLALQSIRAGEVGVYHLEDRTRGGSSMSVLRKADEVMSGRGWERLVGVVEEGQTVAVYVKRDAGSTGDLKVCFAVMARDQLVVGSARSDLEPLMKLANGWILREKRGGHGRATPFSTTSL